MYITSAAFRSVKVEGSKTMDMTWPDWIVAGFIFLVFLTVVLFNSLFTVRQQTAAIVERFGKYVGTRKRGLNMKLPFIERVVANVSLALRNMEVDVPTISKEETSVTPTVTLQYIVTEANAQKSHYLLQDPKVQIAQFVENVVRARVPDIELMDLFRQKDAIATAIEQELKAFLLEFGYEIVKVQVTNIKIDPKVQAAMNQVNEMRRLASVAEEEARKLAAEGRGEGARASEARVAIARGIVESVKLIEAELSGRVTGAEALTTLLATQYMEVLRELAAKDKGFAMLLPSGATGGLDIFEGLRNSIISSQLLAGAAEGRTQ
jgi:regulator of protease activity HflC (stomatin/prohibitin superfamily)